MDSLPGEFVQVTMVDGNVFLNILKHNIGCLTLVVVASHLDLRLKLRSTLIQILQVNNTNTNQGPR